jgi:hypothetical protein
MKRRKSALAAAGALLAVFAIAGPVGADSPFNGQSNSFHYGDQYYGSEQNLEQPIPEPGQTLNDTNKAYKPEHRNVNHKVPHNP